MSATHNRRRSRSRRPDVIQKPAGTIHPRVRTFLTGESGEYSTAFCARFRHNDSSPR